jgi:hypothetical protein
MWTIDGRDMEVPAGTVYQVHFKWNLARHEVYWEEVSAGSATLALQYEHQYYLTSTSTQFRPVSMLKGEDDTWQATLRIGAKGKEEFQILRDKDPEQAIYPAKSKGEAPACGPDNLSGDKFFVVKGAPGESVALSFKIVDGHISVQAGSRSWESLEGWERHRYYAIGSFNDGIEVPMEMDPLKPGVFTCRIKSSDEWSVEANSFLDVFQILIDRDLKCAYYPDETMARSADVVVRGPDANAEGRTFAIRSSEPDTPIDITLDLTAEDFRKRVSFGLAMEAVKDI